MERLWLKSYTEGVPADVNVDAYHSVVDIFHRSVGARWVRPAYVQMGASLSLAQINPYSRFR